MKRARKTWNGGSVEAAMKSARKWRDKMIAQGASICDECGGEGGNIAIGVCFQCRGAGVIVPDVGLLLNPDRD